MGADAFHVYFGLRFTVASDEELEALENRTDARIAAARKARLQICFGRPSNGEPHFLLIGREIGTFGIESRLDAALSASELQLILGDTTEKLRSAGFVQESAFWFQVEAQY